MSALKTMDTWVKSNSDADGSSLRATSYTRDKQLPERSRGRSPGSEQPQRLTSKTLPEVGPKYNWVRLWHNVRPWASQKIERCTDRKCSLTTGCDTHKAESLREKDRAKQNSTNHVLQGDSARLCPLKSNTTQGK